jgi:hypothetical protein
MEISEQGQMASKKNSQNPILVHLMVTALTFVLLIPASAYAAKSVVGIDVDPGYHGWENLIDF